MKKLLFSLAISFCGAQAFAQTPQAQLHTNDPLKKSSITLHTPGVSSQAQGSAVATIIENFNPEKITGVFFNYGLKTFTLSPTAEFNMVETLSLFREHGLEAYYIENGMVVTLNKLANALVSVPYSANELP